MTETHDRVEKSSLFSVKTFGICLAGVVIAIIAVTVFNVPLSTIGTAAIFLACPLLHLLMMRDGHKH
ncbi:MAG: hypothetical protein UT63_C0015G0016 [Candidatus Gottesmanbacteria bacterium GW2011_GWC2_39_8]|uniref:DUF2933 domain-containing protein n=1 Tax=Candidatus Gottesmanbacteria bacterium GW2011_GWC2_39_8 TaxID=1618450 RepID=A0A0G0SFN6_9BACT|nr:MAG: hypothetical protein UT63_C0015G0016 [Candidatus Gottesmanbacteria bacterium GW2011_GWC2_39_8]